MGAIDAYMTGTGLLFFSLSTVSSHFMLCSSEWCDPWPKFLCVKGRGCCDKSMFTMDMQNSSKATLLYFMQVLFLQLFGRIS